MHYLFGGNPGLPRQPKLRLADFWTLRLLRVDEGEILRRCRLQLRQQAFRELSQTVGWKGGEEEGEEGLIKTFFPSFCFCTETQGGAQVPAHQGV
jgi:hypothetical protein